MNQMNLMNQMNQMNQNMTNNFNNCIINPGDIKINFIKCNSNPITIYISKDDKVSSLIDKYVNQSYSDNKHYYYLFNGAPLKLDYSILASNLYNNANIVVVELPGKKEERENRSRSTYTYDEIISDIYATYSKMIDIDCSSLNLSGSNFSEIHLTKLFSIEFSFLLDLNLSENKLINCNFFKNSIINTLSELNLSKNKIKEINNLKNVTFPNLTTLYLGNNEIEDISVFKDVNFNNLALLGLSNNKIKDISVLENAKFPILASLYLSSNQIEDISVLSETNFPSLFSLYLDENKISNISVFNELNFVSLSFLDIHNNLIQNTEENKNIIEKFKNTLIGVKHLFITYKKK